LLKIPEIQPYILEEKKSTRDIFSHNCFCWLAYNSEEQKLKPYRDETFRGLGAVILKEESGKTSGSCNKLQASNELTSGSSDNRRRRRNRRRNNGGARGNNGGPGGNGGCAGRIDRRCDAADGAVGNGGRARSYRVSLGGVARGNGVVAGMRRGGSLSLGDRAHGGRDGDGLRDDRGVAAAGALGHLRRARGDGVSLGGVNG
jgi:hypothetical protein